MATQETIIKPGTPEAKAPLKRNTVIGIALAALGLLALGALWNQTNNPPRSALQVEPQVPQNKGREDSIDDELKRQGIDPNAPLPVAKQLPSEEPQQTADEKARASGRSAGTQVSVPPRAQRDNSSIAGIDGRNPGVGAQRGDGSDGQPTMAELDAAGRVSKSVVVDTSGEPARRGAEQGGIATPQQTIQPDARQAYEEQQRREAQEREQRLMMALAGGQQERAPASRAQVNEAWVNSMAKLEPAQTLRPQLIQGRYVLAQGQVIPAILTRGLISDLPGEIVATAAVDIYDSFHGHHLLIPKGSRLVGAYNSGVNLGQERIMFAFTRLILPNGVSFTLPGATGMDLSGAAGIGGDVNNHFFKMFGNSLLIALLADRVERNDPAQVAGAAGAQAGGARSAAGQVLVDTSRSILERNRMIPPTITVPVGTRINVQVVRDMEFPSPFKQGALK